MIDELPALNFIQLLRAELFTNASESSSPTFVLISSIFIIFLIYKMEPKRLFKYSCGDIVILHNLESHAGTP